MASRLGASIRITGVRETLRAFDRLPKDAADELRTRSHAIAKELAVTLRGLAMADSAQSAAVAPTVQAVRDRMPSVTAGGSRRVGRNRAPASGLLFGSEFGMTRRSGWFARPRYGRSVNRQYRPHGGAASYWFFRGIKAQSADMAREWQEAADEIADRFGRAG